MRKPGFRILFLLYFTPPAQGTAPKRNFRMASHLSDLAERSIILTSQYPGKPPLQHPGMDVHAIPSGDYRAVLRRTTPDGYLPEEKKKSAWTQWGIKLINTFPFSILFGEGGFLYFINLLRKGQSVIRREKITHIYSSFRPFADHYAAYCLKKWNPRVVWIADFRDLPVDPHTHHILWPQLHEGLFRKIFRTADLLTTVSDGLVSHLKRYNPNVIVVRNSISQDWTRPEPRRTDRFTITYTGSMFLQQRNPRPLFEAIRELTSTGEIKKGEIEIIYAGKDGAMWERMAGAYGCENVLRNKGIVPDDAARQLQSESCINVLLTISSDEFQGMLTGKMIEYVEAGSPVLAIVAGNKDDELSRILAELQIGDVFTDQPSDLEAIRDFILREYKYWTISGTNRKPLDASRVVEVFSAESTMKPLRNRIGIG